MKLLTKPLMLIALFVLSVGVIPMAEANCTTGACVVVWEDNFNGSAVDPLKWEFENGNGCQYGPNLCGWGNNELQWYRPENAVVANGELTITAEKDGNNYYSSRLRTKGLAEWTYGRFEMRAKLPTGQGMWPAFWMLPTNSPYGSWARSGEIDIMEMVGNEPDIIHGTIHYHDNWPDNLSNGTSTMLTPPGTAKNDFHTYAVEWEEDEIRWYVDGNLYHTVTWWDSVGNPWPAPFDVDFHLLLNLAIGGNWPGNPDGTTVFPQEYVIDYVRVYQPDSNPPPSPPILVFDDMEHGDPFANGWFSFNSSIGGGGLGSNTDLPPQNGGSFSVGTGWGSGGTPGYFGGFGRTHPVELTPDLSEFRMWINPDAGQDYTLEINLQEDDNGDGNMDTAVDEEFQFNCVITAFGPCAFAGAGWQLVTIPLADFFDDNSFYTGGNGVLDAVSPVNGGNGELINIVVAVISNSGADVNFRTDYWTFNGELPDTDGDGIPDALDNCINVANPGQEDPDADGHGTACDGDFNQDCDTNGLDIGPFKAQFFGTNPEFDLNNDGVVNGLDIGPFKDLFFQTPGPSTPIALCSPS